MKKLNDILEASPLLGKMINMGGRRAKVTSIAKQGDGRYDTDYEIRFLDDNTKTVLSDPMVRAFMESVELDERRQQRMDGSSWSRHWSCVCAWDPTDQCFTQCLLQCGQA